MPTTSLTFDNQLLTTTLYAIIDEMKSQIDRPVLFVDNIEKNMETEDGGERLIIPLNFDRHSTTTQLSTGYEPINMTVQPLGTPGFATWGDWIRPVVISGHEERINRGKYKVLDILEERAKDTYNGMRLDFQRQLVTGDVTTLSDCNTINGSGTATSAADTTGFLETLAVGAQTNTVVNVDKTAHQTSLGWQNQSLDLNGPPVSTGTTLIDGLYDQCVRIRELAAENASKLCIYGSLEMGIALKEQIQTFERYVDSKELDAGRTVMMFNGIPIELIRDVGNNGNPAALTETDWGFTIIDHASIKWVSQSGYHFKTGEFVTQSGYDVRASFLHLMGQLKTNYLGSSSVLYDVTV